MKSSESAPARFFKMGCHSPCRLPTPRLLTEGNNPRAQHTWQHRFLKESEILAVLAVTDCQVCCTRSGLGRTTSSTREKSRVGGKLQSHARQKHSHRMYGSWNVWRRRGPSNRRLAILSRAEPKFLGRSREESFPAQRLQIPSRSNQDHLVLVLYFAL